MSSAHGGDSSTQELPGAWRLWFHLSMNLSDFDYALPKELIASHPMQPRDQSRLMYVRRATGEISHHVFAELPELLRPKDLMVFNNTKVFPARLFGHRLGLASQSYSIDKTPSATIEVLLLKTLGDDIWEVLVKPGRKMRVGERVRFGSRLECEVVDRGELGSRRVKFFYHGNFDDLIDTLGHVPIASVHRPAGSSAGQGRVSNHLRQKARRCGSSYRGIALHARDPQKAA